MLKIPVVLSILRYIKDMHIFNTNLLRKISAKLIKIINLNIIFGHI